MNNESFRITSKSGRAHVWSVGEFHYSIKWDDEGQTHTCAKQHIDALIKTGYWIVTKEYARGCDNVPFDAYTEKLHTSEQRTYDISSLQLKIVVDNSKANEMIAETIALSEKLQASLQKLKKAMAEDDFVKIDFEGIL